MAKRIVAKNALINGWGYVEGKWVYVPLWDPAPEAFRQLIAVNALVDAAVLISNKDSVVRIKKVAASLIKKAADGFIKAVDADIDICPPFPWPWPRPPFWPPIPWPPIPWPWNPHGPGPDPSPLDSFFEGLNPVTRNIEVGKIIVKIGEMIADKDVISLGNDIAKAQ